MPLHLSGSDPGRRTTFHVADPSSPYMMSRQLSTYAMYREFVVGLNAVGQ